MKKRGMSHIEIILSFIIFIAAVTGIFYFFNPASDVGLIQSTLLSLSDSVTEQGSTELTRYVISFTKANADQESEKNDLAIGVGEDFPGGSIPENADVLATDLKSNKQLKWDISTKDGKRDTINIDNTDELGTPGKQGEKLLLYIYISEGIDGSLTRQTEGITASNKGYAILSSFTRNILSEKKISEIPEDAELIRKRFNIPATLNFEFELKLEGRTIRRTTSLLLPDASDEVFIETKRVEALREDGKIEFADLIVKTW